LLTVGIMMSLTLVRPPKLGDGETIRLSRGASRQPAGAMRIIGGRLFLTNHRLVHKPGPLERLIRAREWGSPLHEIANVSRGPRFTSLIAAFGQQLLVELTSGDIETFRVWRASPLEDRIRDEIKRPDHLRKPE
jgi:hypothetical protein